jgi:23S rRNA (cytosine1962-C5)-methyltransferase
MVNILLKRNKGKIILRGHPWVFSGALQKGQDLPENGSVVRLCDSKGNFLAKGHYQDSSIAIRILTYEEEEINEHFYEQRLKFAFELRKQFIDGVHTTAFRWVHGEGDRLPGLIVDYYNGHLVMECHTDGMFKHRKIIASALQNIDSSIQTIYCTSPSVSHGTEMSDSHEFLVGNQQETIIKENKHSFLVNWVEGQKTGFFLDQRQNRQLLASLVQEKEVLNLFSYSGGFSVYAAASGAKKVISVDSSEKAMKWLGKNVELNAQEANKHELIVSDVMDYLKQENTKYDVVIVDPPAFAKSVKKRHNAVQAYKRLNAKALSKINAGGFLMTFSCSQVVSPKLFYDTIKAAFIETKSSGQIIQKLSQGPDHPVMIKHEEGHYLKGLLIRVY